MRWNKPNDVPNINYLKPMKFLKLVLCSSSILFMAQAEATPHYLWKTDKIESNLDYSFELPQQVTVRGQLVDEQGAPVSNASILVKGTNEGAKSDEQGKFSFQTGNA